MTSKEDLFHVNYRGEVYFTFELVKCFDEINQSDSPIFCITFFNENSSRNKMWRKKVRAELFLNLSESSCSIVIRIKESNLRIHPLLIRW